LLLEEDKMVNKILKAAGLAGLVIGGSMLTSEFFVEGLLKMQYMLNNQNRPRDVRLIEDARDYSFKCTPYSGRDTLVSLGFIAGGAIAIAASEDKEKKGEWDTHSLLI
jgi:hypothetical protein